MPIMAKFNGTNRHSSPRVTWVVLCDFCGEELDQDERHSVQYETGDAGECKQPYFYHFHCPNLRDMLRDIMPVLTSSLKSIDILTE